MSLIRNMGLLVDTKHRTDQVELMDDFTMGGEILRNTLDQIAAINRWLGGNRVTLHGLKKVLRNRPKERSYTIVDMGCGNGNMLREVAVYGKEEGYTFKLIGIDANENTIDYAKELSTNFTEISYFHQDIFSEKFKSLSYDIVLANLFLHHFTEDKIVDISNSVVKKTTVGLIINDLHRHRIAYYLFKCLCLIIRNPMVKEDGLISILRGFKRMDLERISKKLNNNSSIQWKWAFRYLWIIQKNK